MKKIFCIAALAALVACSMVAEEKPTIERDKFVDVLIDLYANEGIFAGTYNLDSASINLLMSRNETTLKGHDVSKQEFIETYQYYGKHMEELAVVYQLAIDTIHARKARLQKSK